MVFDMYDLLNTIWEYLNCFFRSSISTVIMFLIYLVFLIKILLRFARWEHFSIRRFFGLLKSDKKNNKSWRSDDGKTDI